MTWDVDWEDAFEEWVGHESNPRINDKDLELHVLRWIGLLRKVGPLSPKLGLPVFRSGEYRTITVNECTVRARLLIVRHRNHVSIRSFDGPSSIGFRWPIDHSDD